MDTPYADYKNTCSTCRYWSGRKSFVSMTSKRGKCEHAKLNYNEDQNTKIIRDGVVLDWASAVSNGTDQFIWTGPDFGCVHHTSK